jgi:hypothetical protein
MPDRIPHPDSCAKCEFLDASVSPCKCTKGLYTVYGYKRTDVNGAAEHHARQLAHCPDGVYAPGEHEDVEVDIL